MIIGCQWSGYILWSICPCSSPVTDWLFTDGLSIHVHWQGYLLMFIIKVIYWQPICPCSSPVIDKVTYRWSICSPPISNHFIYQWLQVCQWSCCLLLTYTSTITQSVDVYVSAIMLSTDHLHVNNHTTYLVMVYMSTITLSSDGLYVNNHVI